MKRPAYPGGAHFKKSMVVNEDHIGAAIIGMWRMGANYYQIAYHLNTTINYVEIIITGFEVLKQTGKINEYEKRI